MALDAALARLIPEIEDNLQAFLDALDFGLAGELKNMLVYHMGWGVDGGGGHGKRIRPVLTLLCTGGLGGDYRSALPAALGIEFLHNFTLIHDDIQDQSRMRHRRPTLWTRWGVAQAVNAGDALFSIAQLALLGLGKTCGEDVAARAAREMNRVCLHLTQGQHLDLVFEADDEIELATYLAMIRGKTAALIAFSTAMGGLAAGADEEIVVKLADYGESLGMAFQIQDDALGIWGDPQVTGKSAASDLLARKKSLPVLFGLRESEAFRTLWQVEDPTPDQIVAMAAALEVCGAGDYVREQAEGYTRRAFDHLARLFPQPNEDAAALVELTGRLLNRDY